MKYKKINLKQYDKIIATYNHSEKSNKNCNISPCLVVMDFINQDLVSLGK